MITRRHLRALLACVGIGALAVGAIFVVQYLAEEPETQALSHDASLDRLVRGTIVLSLSSAMVILAEGQPGGPLRVESSFDPDVYTLAQRYDESDDGRWTWRLDFHERSVLHISVIRVWLGRRSPEVTVIIPPDLPFDLEAEMKGGCLVMDFASLDLSSADVELNRGVVQVSASEPMNVPMKTLTVRGSMGTVLLDRIGNASPEKLEVQHRLGAAVVDLQGLWRTDSDIHFHVALADGRLQVPRDVRVEGLGQTFIFAPEQEIALPTLRVGAHASFGDIRVTY